LKKVYQEKKMRTKWFVLLVLLSLVLGACAPAAPAAEPAAPAEPVVETVVVKETQLVEVEREVVVTPTPGPNPNALFTGVEEGAELTVWTFWLSPTFDEYIADTIAGFEAAYPGVKVNWEDHQATFRDDLNNSFAAGNAPDVINLSISEGWVTEYASQGNLLALDEIVPQEAVDTYFPNLWDQQMVDGMHYQFPYYQGIQVNLVNKQIFEEAGLTIEDFPETIDGLPALCQTIKDETGKLCDIRLTISDLLAQMVYEGGVDIINEDGTEFTFDSPEAVEWLQMYVDMVAAGTVDRTVLVTDQDRVGLDLFISGQAPFYATGPNLIREVRTSNPALYGYLDVVNSPVGKSGVVGKGLMAMSVNANTEYPVAAAALAQWFTNAESNLALSKLAAVYPSTPASYDDPFFAAEPVAIEDSAKPRAKEAVSQLADIVPNVPEKAAVNEIVLQAVQQALFNNVPAQDALTDAVEQANALIQ
jgi:ABC-type glycerol-3-phosphate transport system substrate-binding protein